PAVAKPRIKCGINFEPGSRNTWIPGQARNDGLRSFTFDQTDRLAVSSGAYVKLRPNGSQMRQGVNFSNPKHQIPNFKQAPSTKSQYPNKDKSLSKVFCLEFGAWNLEFV
ncbi:MAG: hypothetical protein K9L59_01905, partial [Desulfobacterales bacterium]|nr:hypothetical protein [Desulfobacterales bacterium]